MNKADRARVLRERDWWKRLATAYGMDLYGFDGMPPSGGAFAHEGHVVQVPGALAQPMYDMAIKAGVLPANKEEG